MSSQVVFWLVIVAACAIVELLTMGLTSIWFACGALVSALVALPCKLFWVQMLVFLAVSICLLVFTKPVALKYFNKGRLKTNAESLIGHRAIVVSEIDNIKAIGEVTVNGFDWSARTETEGVVIPEKAVVVIKRIEGVKLIVDLDDSLKGVIPLERSDALLDPEVIEEQED
ncbi:MAG: NfeD family protein [Lachnospiraceae bacterium]|nr:NfeD family protein [Lachnospiraceae bacterium]